LSANSPPFCLLAITGSSQALLAPATAPAMSSVRDTAIASKPLNGVVSGSADVRFA
jgi:hypothetical protein